MKKLYKRENYFTLVEIMVAMAILVILMGFLFEFVIGAQEIWTSSRKVSSLYDKAQIAMRWIEADLQAAMYQSEQEYPGRAIPFCIEKNGNQLQSINVVVCRKNSVPDTDYYTLPVKYEIYDGALYRTELPDLDFTTSNVFPASHASSNMLLDGIDSFTIQIPGNDLNQKPMLVKLEMTLFDLEMLKEIEGNEQAKKRFLELHSRVFSKIIFLNE